MDWSTRKKMKWYIGFGAIVLAIVGWFVYTTFLNVAPTCSDGKQNQNERGIDCGGVCTRVCPMDAKTIVPLWYRVFEITPGVNSLVAYVENQNPTAGVAKINYQFRVYDQNNILSGEPVTGTTFVGPNDRTAIFASPFLTGNRIPRDVFFEFTTAPDWMVTDAKYRVPQLTSRNVVITDATVAPKISADIVNATLFDYRNIPVVAIVYGKDGNAMHASQTFIDLIPQQSTQTVYFTWPRPFGGEVGRIEIVPRLNPFEQR